MPQPTTRPRPAEHAPSSSPNKPVEKFTDGPVHVSIWENEGPKGAFRAASFGIRYRDGENQWQTGKSYSSTALLHLESAAREARSRIESWRQARASQPAPRR